MSIIKKFSERLRELRQDKGLSLKKLANAIGVTDIAISRWENQTRVPNIEALVLLANYFGVSTDYMLGLED